MRIRTVIDPAILLGMCAEDIDPVVRMDKSGVIVRRVKEITLETRWFEGERGAFYIGYDSRGRVMRMMPAKGCYVSYAYDDEEELF